MERAQEVRMRAEQSCSAVDHQILRKGTTEAGGQGMMEIEGWQVFRSAYGMLVAKNDKGDYLIGETFDEIIIKIDQANHPERCEE